jgi:HlyD family secretion protein
VRRSWLAAALGILIVTLGATGAWFYRRSAQPTPRSVQAAPRPLQPIQTEVSFSGKILPVKIVEVRAPLNGIVDQVLADVGDDVFEGQILAHLKNPRLETSVQNARNETDKLGNRVNELQSTLLSTRLDASRSRADATRAKMELERAEKAYQHQAALMQEGATPRLVFEKAEKEYNSQKADLETIEALAAQQEDRVATLGKELSASQNLLEKKQSELEDAGRDIAAANIVSPADGVIAARHIQPGEQINRAQPNLFEIGTNLTDLQVSIVPQNPKMLAGVHKGQAAAIEIAEAPGSIPGTVREIRDAQILVEFTSPAPIIRPGLTAQVKIKL